MSTLCGVSQRMSIPASVLLRCVDARVTQREDDVKPRVVSLRQILTEALERASGGSWLARATTAIS